MAICGHKYPGHRPKRPVLARVAAWLLIIAAGMTEYGRAGAEAKEPQTGGPQTTTNTARPASAKTATFAMG